jgi:hypothetical protein
MNSHHFFSFLFDSQYISEKILNNENIFILGIPILLLFFYISYDENKEPEKVTEILALKFDIGNLASEISKLKSSFREENIKIENINNSVDISLVSQSNSLKELSDKIKEIEEACFEAEEVN